MAVRRSLSMAVSGALLTGLTSSAQAEITRLHGAGGVAHAVGSPQSSELAWGAAGTLALELPLGKAFGAQAELGVIGLAKGDSPADKTLAARSSAAVLTGMIGFRAQPAYAGIWLDLNGGFGNTGGHNRFAFDAHIGYDFVVGGARVWQVGPVLGYVQLVQPNDTLRPEDGRVLWLGVHIAFGKRPSDASQVREPTAEPSKPAAVVVPTPPPVIVRADRDKDTVFDDEDACPDVPGVRSSDPKASGCPAPSESVRMEGALIILDDVIHFEVDSPRVRHASWDAVKKVATFINATPDITEINVEGHADESGTSEHNLVLSGQRSESVKQLLVRFGVDAARLTTRAFGADRPRASGHTELELRQNRRVEFIVVRSRQTEGAAK